jgi:hypothetical protein
LARQEFETKLILKAIETPDRQEAIRNLQFFLSAGFIQDKEGKIANLGINQYPSLTPSLLRNEATANFEATSSYLSDPRVGPLIRAVGRLEYGPRPFPVCTGWLIAPAYFITASFCAQTVADKKAYARFGYISEQETGTAFSLEMPALVPPFLKA